LRNITRPASTAAPEQQKSQQPRKPGQHSNACLQGIPSLPMRVARGHGLSQQVRWHWGRYNSYHIFSAPLNGPPGQWRPVGEPRQAALHDAFRYRMCPLSPENYCPWMKVIVI
jgi:hypothetical protein